MTNQTLQTPESSEYNEDNIKVLQGLEPVKQTPGMYIGDVDDGTGLHHMVSEVVDNSIDEIAEGHGDCVIVKILADGGVSVEDNGRGIPTGILKEQGLPALTVIMTTLHAGGKFDSKSYRMSGGLHGVGVSVVNALSSYLHVTTHRDGQSYSQKFVNAEPTTEMQHLGSTEKSGTVIQFKPSDKYFTGTVFEFDILLDRLRQLSYLNPGARIELTDERIGVSRVLQYDGGIGQFISELNQNSQRDPINSNVITIADEQEGVIVNAALQWCRSYYKDNVRCYTNNIHQAHGGNHLKGFRSALTHTVLSYMKENKLEPKIKVEGSDIREGLTAVLTIKIKDPSFSSQTKEKLVSNSVEGPVRTVISEGLKEFLEENPDVAKAICEKTRRTAETRIRVQKTKESSRESDAGSLPGKLADCQEKEPANRELFLVEGESAGGSAKQARDRKFQAILPLKGKILNVQKASLDKVLTSEEIQTLITALGTGVDEDFNIDNLRYHRIIIMTDADIDGSHIRTLLLTFFYNKMPQLIEDGHLYIAQPPLYKAKHQRSEQYLNDDSDLDEFVLNAAVVGAKVELLNGSNEVALMTFEQGELRSLCEQRARARNAAQQITEVTQIEPLVLEVVGKLGGLKNEHFDTKDDLETFAKKLESELTDESARYTVEVATHESNGGQAGYFIRVKKDHMGSVTPWELDRTLVNSSNFETITNLANRLNQYDTSAVSVQRGSKSVELHNLNEAVDWLMQDARNSMTIQRYKGLGEMNADQLRETTMDSEERILRQVKIEDSLKTDGIFEILMGDKVPPRREFIQEEALTAKNIDY